MSENWFVKFIIGGIFASLLVFSGFGFAHWQQNQQQIKTIDVYSPIITHPILKQETTTNRNKPLSKFDKLLADNDKSDPSIHDKQQLVLGAKTQADTQAIKTPPPNPLIKSGKKNITIAIVGDSIIDTMGTNLPYLEKQLQIFYPQYTFKLYNYGIGSQNIIDVSARIDKEYKYKDRDYPAIADLKPDLIILGTTAYNPLELNQISEFQDDLGQLIDKLKNIQPNLALFVPLAPLKKNFGIGPDGVNWPSDAAWNHATKIQAFIEAAITVGKDKQIDIIDNYHPTLNSNGEGIADFISKNDGIHPSISGHQYLAKMLAEYIAKHNLL